MHGLNHGVGLQDRLGEFATPAGLQASLVFALDGELGVVRGDGIPGDHSDVVFAVWEIYAELLSAAGLHPATYAEAERRRVLCGTTFDTVLTLGGSASYLSAADIDQLRARAKRDVLLMHFAAGEAPPTGDLDADVAEESLRIATAEAREQFQIGRFIASVLPGVRTGEFRAL